MASRRDRPEVRLDAVTMTLTGAMTPRSIRASIASALCRLAGHFAGRAAPSA